MPIKRIAFIGSRKLAEPAFEEAAKLFYHVAKTAANLGHIIRSGGASGADFIAELAYFDAINETTADPDQVEIFVPWRNFQATRGINNPLHHLHVIPSDPALIQRANEMVYNTHPNPRALSQGALKLHSRNMNQVFGLDLNTPIDLCICWTENGIKSGGTASAITLCERNNIPVFNLGNPNTRAVLDALNNYFGY